MSPVQILVEPAAENSSVWRSFPAISGVVALDGTKIKANAALSANRTIGALEEEVKKMLERRELYGYRDGADWKFKAEEVEELAAAKREAPGGDESRAVFDLQHFVVQVSEVIIEIVGQFVGVAAAETGSDLHTAVAHGARVNGGGPASRR